MSKFNISRWTSLGWSLVHTNIDCPDIATVLLYKLKQENPDHLFKVLQYSETVIYEDKKK